MGNGKFQDGIYFKVCFLRKIMSALLLCMGKSNWECFSGMLRPHAFGDIILVAYLACLVGKCAIVRASLTSSTLIW